MSVEDYIMSQLEIYANSSAGRKVIKKKYGIDYQPHISTKISAAEKGEEMKAILLRYLQENIGKHSFAAEDIIVTTPRKRKSGGLSVMIKFADGSLERDSLNPNDRLRNIVLLFTKGYDIEPSKQLVGTWKYKGRIIGENVSATLHREPNDFMRKAVDEFNLKNKGSGITAILQDPYN